MELLGGCMLFMYFWRVEFLESRVFLFFVVGDFFLRGVFLEKILWESGADQEQKSAILVF
jgi:hypothetical protein